MPEQQKLKTVDPASQKVIQKAKEEGINIVWDRVETMQPQCGFGQLGVCCTICAMGPCRIDPFGEGPQVGICGADADIIAARNLARKIASGAAAHSDHGRGVCDAMHHFFEHDSHHQVLDAEKMKLVAQELGIDIKQDEKKIAKLVAEKCWAEFGSQEGPLVFLKRAPKKRYNLWKKLGILPRGVDREIVEIMHRTHMGVDNDYRNLMLHGMRTSLGDGWGGSMIATELQDILLGSPKPIKAKVNLGVLKENMVNIVVHGHEPLLSEMAVKAAQDPELIKKAKELGAEGINIAGICCTANEILMRHGVPVAGNFLQQELAVITGSVELMMVDIQCIMPALKDVCNCYHTRLITTNPRCKFPGVDHIEFKEDGAYEIAKKIIGLGVENYKNRKKERVSIPEDKEDLVAGFTREIVYRLLGGTYRPSYRPLNDAIMSGRIFGLAGVVGCNNPNQTHDYFHNELVKELIKNDVLVLQTGCSAIACGKVGLLKPDAYLEHAGQGLKEICEAVGIPPVLHLGSCVDNSRILTAASDVVAEGGLGEDISDLPAAGAAPEWMSEKAVSIGFYFAASGVFTVVGARPFNIYGSQKLTKYLTDDMEKDVGGKFAFCDDYKEMARLMLEHIDKKRKALSLPDRMYK